MPDGSREVVQARIRMHGNAKSAGTRSIGARLEHYTAGGFPGFEAGDDATVSSGVGLEKFGLLAHGDWEVPPANTTLSDYEGGGPGVDYKYLIFHIFNWGGTAPEPQATEYGELTGDWGIQFELLPAGDPALLGNLVGFNLEVWADVDGAIAPSGSPAYKAGAGNLMTKPCDIMRHWIEGQQAPPTTITATQRLSGYKYQLGGWTSMSTSNLVPTADVTHLLAINVEAEDANEPDTPTVTGGGLGTWTLVDSSYYESAGIHCKLFVFRASSSSPGAMAPVVIDFDTQEQSQASCLIARFDGTDITTNDGVVQSADNSADGSSLTVTLAAFGDASNATYGAFGTEGSNVFTVGSGFAEIETYEDYVPLLTEFKGSNDTSVDATMSGSDELGGVAVELTATSGAAPLTTVHSGSYDNCATNLDDNVWAFDMRTLGSDFETCLARMAYEARATIVPEETSSGTEWKMLTALSTYHFSAASGSVTEWAPGGFVEADQDVRHAHASRFTFPYAPDFSKGDGEEAFAGLVVANKDDNDLPASPGPTTAQFVTAAAELGSYDAEPMALKCSQQEATAEEIAGYYCHERIRVPARLFAVREVPWWEGYALEVGDIMTITPPWESAGVKCRIIEVTKDPSTEQIELRAVEVE
jgi:hypothetical protein